jgi:prepilin-type N-terminal cleavage/methylation domain-containing protein
LNKGFTLIELIAALLVFSIVGGLALNALTQSSNGFNRDKKTIESSQNLSAVLEMIGNDIKQAGEQIDNSKFPVITIDDNPSNTGSSRITIRRALASSLTLCQQIKDTNTSANTTTLVVADDTAISSCNPSGSLTTSSASIKRPTKLMEARNYRCKLDDPNADYSSTTTDYCLTTKATPDLEKIRAAMSDSTGNIRIFSYTDDTEVTANKKYSISIADLATSIPNSATTYDIGKSIYLIEERTYTLDSTGNLWLKIDEKSEEKLISGISAFNISAKIYSDTKTKEINANPTNACTVAQDPDTPTTPTADNPKYACSFTASATYDWKTLAGVKVKLQAKYDSAGQSATATATDLEKLTARAEFFPRNVLSK